MKRSLVWMFCLWPVLGIAREPVTGLLRYDRATLEVVTMAQSTSVAIATARGELRIELTPHSLRSRDFQLLVRDGGQVRAVRPDPPRTFTGRVVGEPETDVRATLGPDGLHAILRSPSGIRVVEPATAHGLKGGAHVLYRPEDLAPTAGTCGVDGQHRLSQPQAKPPAGARTTRGPGTVEIVADTDVEYFVANGSDEQATMADIEMVLNAVEVQYERDVDISFEITAILVTRSEPDPYSLTDPRTLLQSELSQEWAGNEHTNVQRDQVHLFTGKNLDGNVIGIAWLGTVCGFLNNGLSQAKFTSSLPRRVDLIAHEMGHNWDANHCDNDYAECCPVPSYTMCSSLKQTVRNAFGATDQVVIEGFRDQIGACLLPPGPVPAGPAIGQSSMAGWLASLAGAALGLGWLLTRRRTGSA